MIIKHAAVILLMSATSLIGQDATSSSASTVSSSSAVPSTPIPKHLVYAHFLSMVADLDQRAIAVGETDPYKFAQPFARAGFENADLDILKNEAQALTSDLTAVDQKAKPLIDAYRAKARSAVQQGQPLPPVAAQLSQLQAERTAVSVNHMMTLQQALGKEATAKLEAYLTREFAPHVSLKALGHAPADFSTSTVPQSDNFATQH